MLRRSLRYATLLLLPAGLLAAPAALAQNTPAATAPAGLNPYTGPRFPGGPDSLRATLQRALRPAAALAGQLFMQLEVDKTGQPNKFFLLTPLDRANATLARTKEAKAIVQQLPAILGPWQPGTSFNRAQPANSIVLPLYFGPQPASLPLPYSEEEPAFFSLAPKKNAPRMSALDFLQRQFRYPAQDLRNQVQGTVYGYYEVSETGAVENRRIISGLSSSIDAELLRVLNTLPDALAPPRQQGRPVRVAYVLPVNLRIQ
jgi:hypothetical protein